jgi:S-DNA-T family DNA segregation ATPase FtsK/SpoIIIE
MASLAALPEGLRPLWPSAFAEGAGGSVGEWLAALAVSWLGAWGGLLAISGAFALGVLYVTGIPAEAALRVVTLLARAAAAGVFALALGLVRLGDGVRRIASRSAAAAARAASGVGPRLRGVARALSVWREQRARRRRVAAEREREAALPLPPAPFEPPGPGEVEAAAPEAEPPSRRRAAEPTIIDHRSEGRRGEPRQETFAFREPPPRGAFRLPDPGIFERAPGGARSYDRDSLIMNSRILEKKLRDFGVLGRVVAVHPGPVITMYEFEPASGIKVNRITNLADDLALAMRALSVRIIAPLPGKSVVGIEVPNPQREVVYLGELVSASSFQTSASKLTIALGKDIFGNPVETVLARMPHLLVAGATGTGKSVFLNALLCSLLSRATPDELRLLLIDPKLLELSIYEGIPHLIADVVTNPKRAAAALGGIVRKMEERYQMMAALGVRSIVQFNERVEQELAAGVRTFHLKAKPGEEQGLEVEFRKLPYIVVVIDELADLMVVSARDVEEALQRLAQMARAAGIHLVLATQRPSVDVLTGVIKANFPARISFQVSSRTDSRTILDQNGAEHLLGQGDMLFLPPGTSKLQRIHGAYVSEKEVSELVAFLRDQGRPEFDDSLLRMNEESEEQDAGGEEVDDLYDRAIAIVAETRNASISYLQRRLKVGYNRAARMIEQMEADRIVGPQDGTKPREVYARPVDVE